MSRAVDIDIDYASITELDNLPSNLETLYCYDNQITLLDNLQSRLKLLSCDDNPLIYKFKPTLENMRKYK